MYWIVFAFFTCAETFTDIFLSWFPFYYELKVVIVIWLLSPVTEGSSVLYRNFVHPMLTKREKVSGDLVHIWICDSGDFNTLKFVFCTIHRKSMNTSIKPKRRVAAPSFNWARAVSIMQRM